MDRRVVITGMGIWSCIGENLEEVKQSLYEGRSGIGIDPARKELGYRSALTGIVREPELKGKVDRRQRHCLSQQGRYAYAATEQALAQAGIDKDFLLENEVGILYGNDSSAEAVINGIDVIREKKNTLLVGSGNIFQSMNSTITMNLSTIFNLRGVNFTISGAQVQYPCWSNPGCACHLPFHERSALSGAGNDNHSPFSGGFAVAAVYVGDKYKHHIIVGINTGIGNDGGQLHHCH